MFGDKFIKKFILLSLFITLPAQAITMFSWLSFLSIKSSVSQFCPDISKVFKKQTAIGTIALGGCIITFLGIRHFEKKKAKKRKQEEWQKKLKQVDWQEEEKERVGGAVAKGEAEKAIIAKQEEAVAQKAETVACDEPVAEEKVKQNIAIIEEQKDEAEAVVCYEAKKKGTEESTLSEDFVEINQRDAEFNCSQLTRGYVKALFSPSILLQDYIIRANNYSSEEREKLARTFHQSIDAEDKNEVRALEYIENGYKNLASILNDNFDAVLGYDRVVACMLDKEAAVLKFKEKTEIRKNYLSSIISVVWCLYDCALRTGDAFTQGAFHEKSKNLYDFFLGYIIFVNLNYKKLGLLGGNCNDPYSYQRISSHLRELAKEKNINQYGIDIRFGQNKGSMQFLPNKMTHILFIPYDPENHKFILKPEDDCMYNFGEIVWHGFGLGRSKWEGLFGSSDSEKHQRKERIPKEIISDFGILMIKASINKEKQRQYNAEVKAWGIQKIVVLAADEFNENTPFYQYVEQLKKKYKHVDMRFGREVIFSENELKKLVNYE